MRHAWIALALVAVAGCGPKKPPAREIPLPAEKLPAIFSPLDWTTTLSDLATKFPGKETQSVRYTGLDGVKMVSELLIDPEWPVIGPALVTISRVPGKPASQLRIEGNGGIHAPVAHNQDLVKRFAALRANLEKEYGPPHATELSGSSAAHGLPRDEREITVSWSREGFVVFASLERTEMDGWVVSLAAVRRAAPL